MPINSLNLIIMIASFSSLIALLRSTFTPWNGGTLIGGFGWLGRNHAWGHLIVVIQVLADEAFHIESA